MRLRAPPGRTERRIAAAILAAPWTGAAPGSGAVPVGRQFSPIRWMQSGLPSGSTLHPTCPRGTAAENHPRTILSNRSVMKELPRTPSRAVAVPTRATVAVIGLGSVGGVAAGCLQEAGRHDVVGCSRRAIDRLTVERPEGTADIPLRTLTDPAEAEPADWVILCTKAHDTVSAPLG